MLSCNATGDPIPYIQWRRNGRVYNNNENIDIMSQSLDILNLAISSVRVSSVISDNIGVYECVAINVLGVVSKSITVTLSGNVLDKYLHIPVCNCMLRFLQNH